MKSAFFFGVLFFSSLLLSAQSDTSTYAPFDWIKINPSESYSDFDWEVLPRGITQAMVESLLASPYITSKDPLTLVYFKEQLLAVLPCRFDVLKWTGDRWDNLYQGTSSGFNCEAHFFVREGKLYSMGSYGFWKGHSELLWFDFDTGFWEPVPALSPPVNYAGVGVFVDGDRIVSILGEYIHQPSKLFKPNQNGYVFDLKSQAWSSVYVDMPNQTIFSVWELPSFDLKDYGLQVYPHEAHMGLLLFHKKDNTLYFSKDDTSSKFRYFTVAVGLENNAVFFDKYGDPTFLLPPTGIWEKFKKVGVIKFTKQTFSVGMMGWVLPILASLGLLLVVGGGFWWRNNQRAKRHTPTEPLPAEVEQGTVDGEEDIERLVNKLLAQSPVLVDVHQLDQLFGTSDLESLDYRRVRRSRYIKAVNQHYQALHGKELIVRTKSEADKRVILYRISP